MELDAIAEPELERIAKLGGADLVVGVLYPQRAEETNGTGNAVLPMIREALAELPKVARTVVVCNNGAVPITTDDESLPVVSCSFAPPGPTESPQQRVFSAYRTVLKTGGQIGARGCAFIVSPSQSATHHWISRLLQPVLELGFDLVAPRYTRHKMEGLLNRSILAPLHRALYGQQLHNPMGPDFGLSGKLAQRVLVQAPRSNPLASMASAAASGAFQICETHLGARIQESTDWTNLSSLLAEVLGPVFLEIEKQASLWQSLRGSRPLPAFGSSGPLSEDGQTVDTRPMIESFHLGAQNLSDVWGLFLPPTTLLELRKLSRLPADQFRMPDELWVRIVYDFALGHRLRTVNRDHLLRSITPLYLGWIASYALEMAAAGPLEVESGLERLSRAYETNKAYLVSRWRWPDRFNP